MMGKKKTGAYMGGGMAKKKGSMYNKGGMPMVMKAGKKVPAFAADGAVAVDIVDASGVGADNLSGTHYLCYFHPT